MRYKENWPESKKRFEAFWQRELVDRCLVGIQAPKPNVAAHSAPVTSFEQQWTDAPTIIANSLAHFERTAFLGDAFPHISLNLGASGHCGFFKGAKAVYAPTTVWFEPTLKHIGDLQFDEQAKLYQKSLELARAYVADAQGEYFVSMPDTTGNADALCHLLGSEVALEMMLTDPEEVGFALQKIQAAYARIMRDVRDITIQNNQGGTTVGWLNTWAPGFHAQMQCDMSVMISKKMFDRFVMPELEAQCDLLEYPLYHFDGIEQIRHLDSLLSIDRLKAIQWTQVAAQPPATDCIDQLKRIQQAGKCLVIVVTPDQIEPLMSALSSRGLYLLVYAESIEQAEFVEKQVARLTRD